MTTVQLKRNFDTFNEEPQPNCPQVNFKNVKKPEDNMDEENPVKRQKQPFSNFRVKRTNYFPISDLKDKDFSSEIKNVKRRQHKLFTEEEVKDIVKFHEEKISDHYNKILQELLQEQFNSFVNFNQDCISKQFKDRESTYFS